MEEAAAAAVAAAAAESGWFWWLSYLSPFAWGYWLIALVLPDSVMWFLNVLGLFLGCCVSCDEQWSSPAYSWADSVC
jgi:hypothetical protein